MSILAVKSLEIQFNPLLGYLFEGLLEYSHPYCFISRAAIKDLLTQENARPKVVPMLNQLVAILRNCLKSDQTQVFSNGLYGVRLIDQISIVMRRRTFG